MEVRHQSAHPWHTLPESTPERIGHKTGRPQHWLHLWEANVKDQDIVLGDQAIRKVLRSNLIARHSEEVDTVIVEELGVCRGQVRVDVAVVNGALHGYEIKSDRDSLRRLSIQAEFYGKVLDRATLVVGNHHLNDAPDLVPSWWGVLHVQMGAGVPRFKVVRRGRKNPGKDPRALVELLWREEAIALLEERKAAHGVRGKPRWRIWDRICECFSIDEIAAAVRAGLKTRAMKTALP